jgi:glucose-6-phosphate 1-dehydrogenase
MAIEQQMKQTGPLTLVIFGITGDLAGRMLLPALYDLALQQLLPSPLRIVGIARRQVSLEKLLQRVESAIIEKGDTCDPTVLKSLGERIEFIPLDLSKNDDYSRLGKRLNQIEEEAGVCMNRLFYMAIPPQLFNDAVSHLGDAGLNHTCPHGTGESRLLVEKPFGFDLASAQDLIGRLRTHFKEGQVYRIDHFLAKETAQNILTFRFRNSLFRDVWNRRCIRKILVTADETLDIEGRANFYEQTGALRDMVQSHVLQMLALATMDIPDAFTAQAIHAKKLALLQAIEPAKPENAVRGQYKEYRQEASKPESNIETFAALRVNIANERWRDVPVVLHTGKALSRKTAEITVVFTDHDNKADDNTLTIRLSPDEGITLHLRAKKPGFDNDMQEVTMDFSYNSSFGNARQPTAYERVLIDAFRGDQTLFATSEEVLANWRIIEPVLHAWSQNQEGLHQYAKGSTGPAMADKLIAL